MLKKYLILLDRFYPFSTVSAHCDIPCGIYDPNDMVEAAKTVRKMQQKIAELPKDSNSFTDRNNFVRFVLVKEEHGRKCKHELLTLWTDYFKPEHLEKVPELHEKVWQTAKLASKAKQSDDVATGEDLVKACEEIAAMFEKVEGAPSKE